MDDQARETLRELLPAYAIGALDDVDLRLVEAQLAEHPEVARELDALRDTAALLTLGMPPVAPPPALKQALMAKIERLEAGEAATIAPAARTWDAPSLPARPSDPPVAAIGAPRPRPGRYRTAVLAMAAALLLALVGWNTLLQLQLRTERQRYATLSTRADEALVYARLLNDPRAAHVVSGSGPGRYNLPPAGYIYTDPNSTTAVMLTYWLPPIDADQQYQLWLITPDGRRDNGGVFSDDGKGNAHVVIHAPADFAQYQSVGVTIEPRGGSAWPTGQRIIGGDIR